jgi:hypothetical protein
MTRVVLIMLASVCLSGAAYADSFDILDCKATEILDQSLLEESFSTFEYPNVSVSTDGSDTYSACIGASCFSRAAGDRIVVAKPNGKLKVTVSIVPSGWDGTISITKDPNGIGKIDFFDRGHKTKIALLKCE